MAECNFCGCEMSSDLVVSCNGNALVTFPDGTSMPAIPYEPTDPDQRCHDCNVKIYGYHHLGCDMERCPKCGGQLISCGCLDEEA